MRGHLAHYLTLITCTAVIGLPSASSADARKPPSVIQTCAYSSRLDDDTLSHRDCAWKGASGEFHVSPVHFRRLDFDNYGLASINIDGGFYYVRRDGRTAPTMMMDNWADPFIDGRARSPVNGKIGYIDRHLTLIISAKYDGAYLFNHGFAVVCAGCKVKSGGEYSWYEGGKWGCIDRSGREQAPFRPLGRAEPSDGVCSKYR